MLKRKEQNSYEEINQFLKSVGYENARLMVSEDELNHIIETYDCIDSLYKPIYQGLVFSSDKIKENKAHKKHCEELIRDIFAYIMLEGDKHIEKIVLATLCDYPKAYIAIMNWCSDVSLGQEYGAEYTTKYNESYF